MESYRRKVRVVSETLFYHEVVVQIKLGFFWITVWREMCDVDDHDEIEYLTDCAEEVAEKFAETV